MAEKAEAKKNQIQRLYRSETNKVLGGVCSGLGEYFHFDSTIIRLLFAILAFFGGSGIILYLILWVITPTKSNLSKTSSTSIGGNLEEIKTKATSYANQLRPEGADKNQSILAIILVGLGVLFLLDSLHIFRINFGSLWPILLILLGILILRRR